MSENQLSIVELERKINDSNLSFYEKIEIERFTEFAKIIGLENGIDVANIFDFIKTDSSIAEIGAGYGRVVKALLNNGFKGEIFAVERVGHLVSYMSHLFGTNENIFFIQEDVKNLKLPKKVDTILWIWSGILELSLKEQEEALRNLKTQLNPNGKIIIETPFQDVKFIGEKSDDNYIRFETDWGKIEAYLSTYEDINLISSKAGLNNVQQILYQTEKDLTRVFYILT